MMSSMMRAHAPATTPTTIAGRANRRAAMRVTTTTTVAPRAVSDASSVEASGDAAPAPPALESEVSVGVA